MRVLYCHDVPSAVVVTPFYLHFHLFPVSCPSYKVSFFLTSTGVLITIFPGRSAGGGSMARVVRLKLPVQGA
jgi:hypothetical protein